ncbi:MAG TPA: hypothetical protein VFN75_08345 [Pseudonocardiaceae bacterium]|nr:hypothetical protein [Pseudonocardiaceae bacterium]
MGIRDVLNGARDKVADTIAAGLDKVAGQPDSAAAPIANETDINSTFGVFAGFEGDLRLAATG